MAIVPLSLADLRRIGAACLVRAKFLGADAISDEGAPYRELAARMERIIAMMTKPAPQTAQDRAEA